MCEQKGLIVSDVSVAELKRDASHALVSGVQFVRGLDGWLVVALYRFGLDSSRALVDARSGDVRSWKSLDAAIRTVEGAGVKVGDLGPASAL